MLTKYSAVPLLIGFILDLLIGDPQGWPHIVRAIGALITALEKLLYPMNNKRLGGALLSLSVLFVCALLPSLFLSLLWRLSPWACCAAESLLYWQLLALTSLKKESLKVYEQLKKGDLPAARHAVSMIVGRDTSALDEAGVARAAVETIAEGACDGVIAPLFWMALGGSIPGLLYKAVNTMDSMIGYRNDRYRDFGAFAARLDDALNYIPARLSALVMILTAPLCGLNGKEALRIWRRDRRKHASPNAGQPEAAMAGALGLRLAGDALYFGKLKKKPYIGDDLRPIAAYDILLAHKLLSASGFLMFALSMMVRGCLYAAL